MPLQYQAEIDAFGFSFDGYEEVENRVSFRWTFEDINHPNNFLPVTKTNPGYKKAFTVVEGWALSFFDTQAEAKGKLKRISEDKPKAYKKLGTHISEGKLQKAHGLCELNCDDEGHFNFFDYVDAALAQHFQVKEQVGTLE